MADLIFLFRIVGYGLAGCDPKIMGIGPVPAIRAMLEKTGIKLEDIDQVNHFLQSRQTSNLIPEDL